jgi:O6-methylguanine-DNA--protein-cysteine methyltransferase
METIALYAREIGGRWFGLAALGESLVATAVASSQAAVIARLRKSLPAGAPHQVAAETPDAADSMLRLLHELEAGDESRKRFTLASDHVPEPLASVLLLAAAVPLGYVASYGRIAKAADTEARVVGRIMAGNPLYPIVACHRVVGADFALVGYAGKTDDAALRDKLARLTREARGHAADREVSVGARSLLVHPVERVLERAGPRALGDPRQRRLFE